MARIRTIKPEFWTDETLTECSLNARLLFIGTWNFADDKGNLEHSAKQLKMKVFPADDVKVLHLLNELIAHGLLIEYSVSGKKYLHIKGFEKHQVINRPSKSQIPAFDDSLITHGTLTECSLMEGKGMERKGEEGNGKEKPAAVAADPTKREIWEIGKSLLGNDSGSFLGKLCKEYGQILVLQAVRDCASNSPAEPKAWLVARCQERRASSGNKSLAIERRNHEAVEIALREASGG